MYIKQLETITEYIYITRLREKAARCEFEEMKERLLEMLILYTPFEDYRK